LAPPTFSTMTGWPSVSPMDAAMMRPNVSVGPPGGNGTIMAIGRVGKSCAASGSGAASAMPQTSPTKTPAGLCMRRSPVCSCHGHLQWPLAKARTDLPARVYSQSPA
jgi:hypothetical protein